MPVDRAMQEQLPTRAWATPAPASRCIPTIHGGYARSYDPMDGGGRATHGAKAD